MADRLAAVACDCGPPMRDVVARINSSSPDAPDSISDWRARPPWAESFRILSVIVTAPPTLTVRPAANALLGSLDGWLEHRLQQRQHRLSFMRDSSLS